MLGLCSAEPTHELALLPGGLAAKLEPALHDRRVTGPQAAGRCELLADLL